VSQARAPTWGHLARGLSVLALGLAFLALSVSQARAPTWGHLAPGLPALELGQTGAPRGAEAGLPLP
jgi:hypothetical protein